MHPRQALRNDLKALLEAALPGVPVLVSRARALKPGEDSAVLLYVMRETIARPPATKGRAGGPIQRQMTVEVVAMRDGRDGDVVDQLDDLCRAVELTLSARADLTFQGTTTEVDGSAQSVRAVTAMTYLAEKFDNLSTTGGSQ